MSLGGESLQPVQGGNSLHSLGLFSFKCWVTLEASIWEWSGILGLHLVWSFFVGPCFFVCVCVSVLCIGSLRRLWWAMGLRVMDDTRVSLPSVSVGIVPF